MKLKQLKKYIRNKIINACGKYDFCIETDNMYTRIEKKVRYYQIRHTFYIDLPDNYVFNGKEITEMYPHVDFTISLDHYTDEYIKYTIDTIFNYFDIWLNYLKIDFKSYDKNKITYVS